MGERLGVVLARALYLLGSRGIGMIINFFRSRFL